MFDQWLQILWFETGKESDTAICFRLNIVRLACPISGAVHSVLGWGCHRFEAFVYNF